MKTAISDTEELNKVLGESGLQLSESEAIKQSYLPYFDRMAAVKEKAAKINFMNPTEEDEKISRECRLELVDIRKRSEEVKDLRKRGYLLAGNVEQAAWNLIKASCQLEEENFRQVEKRKEIEEANRIAKIKAERIQIAKEFMDNPEQFGLENMSEEAFKNFVINQKLGKEARINQEKEEALERERIKKENLILQRTQSRINNVANLGVKWDELNQQYAFACDEFVISIPLLDIKTLDDEKFAEVLDKSFKLMAGHAAKERKNRESLELKLKKEREEKKRLQEEAAQREEEEQQKKREELNAKRRLQRAPDKEKLESMLPKIESLGKEFAALKFNDAEANNARELFLTALRKSYETLKGNISKL